MCHCTVCGREHVLLHGSTVECSVRGDAAVCEANKEIYRAKHIVSIVIGLHTPSSCFSFK